ncbi:MAG: NAD(P)H-dependent oxidoreductase subunit E, partial [Actinomycetota bacterium]|nr:NAD(P)H-dependent oxidoreductase subunit E [Actinomycetota bacterium]
MPGAEARAGRFPGPSLIPDLHAIQHKHGWLPREELERLSRERGRPLYEIEGLVTFYPHFHKERPAAVDLACCHDLSCWLQGSEERIAELRERYDRDDDVHLREVSCIGRCDTAPAVTVNERPAPIGEAEPLVEGARSASTNGHPLDAHYAERGAEPHANDLYAQTDRDYRVLRAALDGSLGTDAIMEELKDSG